MRISDWSSDVGSSDLQTGGVRGGRLQCLRCRHAGLNHQLELTGIVAMRIDAGIGAKRYLDAGLVSGCERLLVLRADHARLGGDLDRKSCVWGESVSVRVGIGGSRNIKKTTVRH